MPHVQPLGTIPTIQQPSEYTSLEEQAKDLCRMVRMSLREYSVLIEKHNEDMEMAHKKTVHQLADSHRSWMALAGRVSATAASLGGNIALDLYCTNADLKKSLDGVVATVPQLVGSGFDVRESYKTADRTEWQALSDNLRRMVEKTSSEMRDSDSQLREFLQTIRQINDDLAQTMRAVRA